MEVILENFIQMFFLISIMLLPIVTGGYTFYKSYKLIEDERDKNGF